MTEVVAHDRETGVRIKTVSFQIEILIQDLHIKPQSWRQF
jgi:hypothetical protein